jgi:hypothetical protein
LRTRTCFVRITAARHDAGHIVIGKADLAAMGNDSTTWPIVLTSVWCRHADVEGISLQQAAERMLTRNKVMAWMENATAQDIAGLT